MKYLGTILAALLLVVPTLVMGQTAPIPRHTEAFTLDSGRHDSPTEAGVAVLAYNEVVEITRVPWIRLRFTNAHLGENSYLVLRSMSDGGTQILNSETIEQWQYTSAYFNGDAVEVQLYVAPGDRGVFVSIDEVIVGEWAPGDPTESQCGPTDDRIPSSDPAACRVVDVGCTAWIICDGWMVSAGHCLAISSFDVAEFNVPLSLPNGTIQHPGPEDQYIVNTATDIFVNGGVGNDYGVFEVFDNSTTGLQPIDAQGAHFEIVQNLGPANIRITGYGVDFNNGDRNQTQQTHVGPNAGSSGTTMRYQTDTEGGNSGSPVIDDATGDAVGVHTHGGCTTGGGGNNSGTSTFNAGFIDALNPHITNCGVGGGIPCEDIVAFQSRCRPSGGLVQARVIMTDDSHNGETMTVTVNGVDYDLTITNYGFGSGVRLGVPAAGGSYTVELTDPAGCFPSNTFTCASNSMAAADDEWDDWGVEAEARTTHAQTTLLGNYPNPFNPSTTISYTLATETRVSLKVYNALGQEVATLVNGVQTAGQKSAVWNGHANDGAAVASGLYFYRLAAGDVVLTERMLLTK